MTDLYCKAKDVPAGADVLPIYALRPADWALFSAAMDSAHFNFAKARGFTAQAGQRVRVPAADGNIALVLLGCGAEDEDHIGPMAAGRLASGLVAGYYAFEKLPADWSEDLAAVAWGMGSYRFERYLKESAVPATLVLDDEQPVSEIASLVDGTRLCRDLINTPAGDMGPVNLAKAAKTLADDHGAEYSEIVGEDLLEQNYPMIHAVGRAAHEAPRLVEFTWGDPSHPRLALIGKGITFDTGGVNMKSASGARIMKKDMGGAAHALALSKIIMETGLPIHLHCLLAIAENAVSASAYRPGDILTARNGLTVEIDNTDAEGRLVLGDALVKASESEPALMIDFATLTGAARVALGPHLPPFFSNRKAPVPSVLAQGERVYDPVWNMPLWQPYNAMLSCPIADMKNSGGGFAGAVTAGLFLERFVNKRPWMHFDTYGWNPAARPSHPKGGDMYAVRALYGWLKAGGLNGDLSR